MPVVTHTTPNPNALKFTVDAHFENPITVAASQETGDPVAAALLGLPGVTSVFMTADFVTISKTPDATWENIEPGARRILEAAFET
jgi:hypothetical protein